MSYLSLEERVERLEKLFASLSSELSDVDRVARHAYFALDSKSQADADAIMQIILPGRPKHPIDRLFDFLPKREPKG